MKVSCLALGRSAGILPAGRAASCRPVRCGDWKPPLQPPGRRRSEGVDQCGMKAPELIVARTLHPSSFMLYPYESKATRAHFCLLPSAF
jgi:hypothetical protein